MITDKPNDVTRVIHRRDATGADDEVYIGRPSKWSNPFNVKKYGRDECITMFETRCQCLKAAARRELRGKTLVCFCAPLPCHGDVLARWADA